MNHQFTPAFPVSSMVAERGLTKREWFAAQAMIGLLAINAECRPECRPDELASAAYAIADAMLKPKE